MQEILTGELMDKVIGMQEKSDKMLMDLELKRARLEEKQQIEEREFQLQVLNALSWNNHKICCC